MTSATEPLRPVDRELLVALRGGQWMSIGELTETLGVTATAVRQRVDRLMDVGLLQREKTINGRGRPTYRYALTVIGHRWAGANPVDLADALWREVLAIEDEALRTRMLASIAQRLGQQFAAQANTADACESIEHRLEKLSKVLATRQIDSEVNHCGSLPVLDIGTCPYPALTDASDDRAMCRLEEQMISTALGQPMHLSSCRLDGDACCQFSAVSDGQAVSELPIETDLGKD